MPQCFPELGRRGAGDGGAHGASEALFEGTRAAITRDLAVSGHELKSSRRAFRSRIDVSMGTLLGHELEAER